MDYETFDTYVLKTYKRFPLTIVQGRGMQVWDENGTEYLDFFPGWGAGNLGHCHPKVVQAVCEQVKKIIHIPNVYYNEPQGKLAQMLIECSFDGQVFFCNSGAEANEGAIKLARKRNPNKKTIITLHNSFHGRTLATLTATGQEEYQQGFDPLPSGFCYCPANDSEQLKEIMNNEVAAILMEPILGEGGIVPLTQEFMETAQRLCVEYDALLILDEVQSGIGRTGKMFAYQNFPNILPDVLTTAKSLGGGIPIGAFIVRKEHCQILQPGNHGSTFGGNPVACSAAIAVLQAIDEENLLQKAAIAGEYLYNKLLILQKNHPCIKEVRGLGLMLGVELSMPGAAIVDKCREQRLLINCTHKNVLRLMPALNVTQGEIDFAVAILDRALAAAEKEEAEKS